jgi:hypothetical protein
MTNLNTLFKNNKEEFDTEHPNFGHELRFEKKLDSRLHKNNTLIIKYSIAIAASLLIVLASPIYIYRLKNSGFSSQIAASQSIEFRETEQFYTEQTKQASLKLKEILVAQPIEITSPLFDELNQLELTYQQLNEELKTNPNDPRVMSTIVQYYQLKLDLLNNLIERFTLYSNFKTKHYENERI